ncbi:YABBY protein [Dillenia turbinata]|uniref:YABBY protein n=1 Tax=Dillenia turbinata TaxID=194707 RepID=A0AAN8V3Y4_9MAGN
MSTLNHLFDLHQEQICYVQCGFCSTILLVSVPCSNMSMVVTVRCGHCTSLLSVKASFVPLHLFASFDKDEAKHDTSTEEDRDGKASDKHSPPNLVSSDDNDDEDIILFNHIVNKPPEKRQRAPSAYNRFIKEEIRRLKAKYPNMTHKEAFSTAAKNWAHFPLMHYEGEGESCSQDLIARETTNSNNEDPVFGVSWFWLVLYFVCVLWQVNIEGNNFRERKVSRRSILAKTPFE